MDEPLEPEAPALQVPQALAPQSASSSSSSASLATAPSAGRPNAPAAASAAAPVAARAAAAERAPSPKPKPVLSVGGSASELFAQPGGAAWMLKMGLESLESLTPRSLKKRPQKQRQQRKRRICFSAAPTVHEFDTASPSIRRMDLRRSKKQVETISFDVLKPEMEARGLDPQRSADRSRLAQTWNAELAQELAAMGLAAMTGSNDELTEKVDLAKALRRRAHLRMSHASLAPTRAHAHAHAQSHVADDEDNDDDADNDLERDQKRGDDHADDHARASGDGGVDDVKYGSDAAEAEAEAEAEACLLPVDLTSAQLDSELSKRKTVAPSQARLAKVVALEEAMLKEGDGFVGDGYDFGRRFLPVEDIVRADECTGRELRVQLRRHGLRASRRKSAQVAVLHDHMESEFEGQVRDAFRQELMLELGRRRVAVPARATSTPTPTPTPTLPVVAAPASSSSSLAAVGVGVAAAGGGRTGDCKVTAAEQKEQSGGHDKENKSEIEIGEVEEVGEVGTGKRKLAQAQLGEDCMDASDIVTPVKRARRSTTTLWTGEVMAEADGPAPATPATKLATLATPKPVEAPECEHLDTNALFDLLYSSGEWRKDYEEPRGSKNAARALSPAPRSPAEEEESTCRIA